jgi:Lysyl oxidase
MRPRTDFPRASFVTTAFSCAAITIACSGQGEPTTTTTSPSSFDSGTVAKDGAAVDKEPPPSTDSGGDSPFPDSQGDPMPDASMVDKDVGPPEGSANGDDADAEASVDAGDGDADAGAGDGGDAATGPQICGFSSCAAGAPCADLTVDRDDLLASIIITQRTFQPTDCAIAEGCITTPGTRTLLTFDTGTVNSGTADLTIGDPTQNACFMFSQCHQHYHFRGVGMYTLYQPDGTTVAAVGHKQGFCLEDVRPDPRLNPPPPDPPMLYDCTHQGLHVGYEDVYPNDIDCQWIDITGVPPGQYILSVLINAGHFLPESNYDNNEERVPVTIE